MTDVKDFSSSVETDSPANKRITFKSIPSFNDVAEEHAPDDDDTLSEDLRMRPRAMSHHLSSTKVPSRKWLTIQARIWRSLMSLGMQFHGWTPPGPPRPDFTRQIQTDTVPIDLYFYVPPGYYDAEEKGLGHRYPVIVNFHGGGFTLGDPRDDRYYARVMVKETRAVFVSVGYRRAPEHPFPGPVDDGVEALMYLSSHASELQIDPGKTALSGFSAGGNLCFTVPFRLTYFTNPSRPRLFPGPGSYYNTPDISRTTTQQSVHAVSAGENEDIDILNPQAAALTRLLLKETNDNTKANASSPSHSPSRQQGTGAASNLELFSPPAASFPLPHIQLPTEEQEEQDKQVIHDQQPERHDTSMASQDNHLALPSKTTTNTSNTFSTISSIPSRRPNPLSRASTYASTLNPDRPANLKIVSILAFYPLLDWTSSRSAKVRSSIKPELTLKKTFTDLFDYSYLPPPDHAGTHVSPYASPALAPDEMVADGLPQRMQIYLCEYDMLLAEGKKFTQRLEDLGKDVRCEIVEGVKHGWDKSPNPFRDQGKIDDLYREAGRGLRAVFDEAEMNPRELKGERIGLGGLK